MKQDRILPGEQGLAGLTRKWRTDHETGPNFTEWREMAAKSADMVDLPPDLDPRLAELLRASGYGRLYRHQSLTWQAAAHGHNVVLCTGTASGKSLAFNLPVFQALVSSPSAKALYVYPTKALTQDQHASLLAFAATLGTNEVRPGIYDGDTPTSSRSLVRQKANLLLTNPEMLHTGMLPHHANWSAFFGQLRYIVIDEMHTYRGVFGSNFANVLRRLLRVANFYGATPQFLMTSATIANPAELGEKLCGQPVKLVQEDGSARGQKIFAIYNPPIVNPALGLRKSAMAESIRLAKDALRNGIQTILFARSRRTVEILLKQLRDEVAMDQRKSPHELPFDPQSIQGYRSGYLPAERRAIEKGLREGHIKLVVATSALELGIDIGDLRLAMMLGFPGSIASLLQQAGRAGRGEESSMAILVATAQPVDQYLANHSEYLTQRTPENALLDPDHLVIFLNHLRCALFELPFISGEKFGGVEVGEFLEILEQNREVHTKNLRTFWMAEGYPAAKVSLRTASPNNVVLMSEEGGPPRTIGQVDLESAYWMVHPNAVYLHGGQQYHVQNLDLESGKATLVPVSLDYYTEPTREDEIELVEIAATNSAPGGEISRGEIIVHSKVTGYKKKNWSSSEILDMVPLQMPETELNTIGYWFVISPTSLASLAEAGLWTNASNDYGPKWPGTRDAVRARDEFKCQVCGLPEHGKQHDVHHKSPFREIIRRGMAELRSGGMGSQDPVPQELLDVANRLDNLITLCPNCHHKAEQNVRMRSGLAGLAYVFHQLAPLFLMCDMDDIGVYFHPEAQFCEGQPAIAIYDMVPAGIGFANKLYELHQKLVGECTRLITECTCEDGCPACVGPAGENGVGGKNETLAILGVMQGASSDV